MIEDKNTEIILCSNIHIDKNYDNVLDVSKSTLVGYLRTHSEYVGDDYTIVPRYRNRLIVKCPYATALKCNYMTFKNPDYENEYVFAFIDNVDFVNDDSVQINYTLDVWHTNHDKMNINKVFVEREHVNDDTIGKHTIEEGLETGDYIINESAEITNKLRGGWYIVVVNKFAPGMGDMPNGRSYGNLYSGYVYILFRTTTEITEFIKAYDGHGIGDAIINIFAIPQMLSVPSPFPTITITTYGYGDVTIGCYILPETVVPYEIETEYTISINETLNGYTPKNNKLFCHPYNYLMISNNAGSDVQYNYEDFIGSPKFNIDGVICPGCSIKMYPINYKKFDDSREPTRPHFQPLEFTYGITAGKYPNCSWSNDAYTNWLTQNAVNMELERIGAEVGMFTGGASELPENIASGFGAIIKQMAIKKQHSFMPNQTKGNINAGDVAYASSALSLIYSKMSIKEEYAKIIDSFFSRYGYQVNETKQPTLHNRTQFDFIKVGGSDNLISGKIPSNDLHEINNICRRGVTIFHNIEHFGDYTINNPIIS